MDTRSPDKIFESRKTRFYNIPSNGFSSIENANNFQKIRKILGIFRKCIILFKKLFIIQN